MIPPAASCRQGGFLSLTNTQIDRQTKLQTLPAVPYGGKARYGTLEVALEGIGALCLSDVRVGKARWCALEIRLEGRSALCLQDSAEGKRGRVPWRGLWLGQVRFASKGDDEKEIVHVHKKATTFSERVGLGGHGNKKKKKVQEKEKSDE